MIRLIDIELYVFLHCISNHERPNPMFKYFKQKYKRCLDPNDETSSCFSIEHFSYDSDLVVDKGNLDNHYQYWVAKNRRGFKPLFDSIHIKDEVKIQSQLERPLHVHKKKWYIKDEAAGWEIDDKSKAIDVVNNVARKNEHTKLDNMYPNKFPGSKDSELYLESVQKSHCDLSERDKKKAMDELEGLCEIDTTTSANITFVK